jgi:LysM repeat protein
MTNNCNKFYLVKSEDNCYNIANNYSISLQDFYTWNPDVGNNCNGLFPNYNVCVGVIGSSTTSTTTTTTSGNGISTPTPTQTGMVGNCNKFYDVKSGDTCYQIAETYSIPLSSFYDWNPAVGNNCSYLWTTYYVCVGTVGFVPPSTTTSQSTTSTQPGNGITTPTPTQAHMIGSCNSFYYVKQGDGCWAIANQYNISLDNFYSWNPDVKNDCSGLWPNYYVCVGIK